MYKEVQQLYHTVWVCVARALASLLSPWTSLPSACHRSWQACVAHTFPSIGDDFLVIVSVSQVCVSSRLDTAGLILEIIKEAWLSLMVWELCNACERLEGGLCFWQENAEIACFIAPLSVKPKAAGRMFVPPVWGSVFNKQKGEETATLSWMRSAQNSVSSVKVTHLVSRQALCHFVMYLLCLFFQEHDILLFGMSLKLHCTTHLAPSTFLRDMIHDIHPT